MKRTMKTVIALVVMLGLMMPTVTFAADTKAKDSACKSKVSVTSIQNLANQLCKGNLGKLNPETLKNICEKIQSGKFETKNLKNCPTINAAKKTPAKTTPAINKPTVPTTTKPVAPTTSKPAAPTTTKPAAPAPAKPTTPVATGTQETQVADLVNQQRAAQGLPALKFNAELSKVAEAKAADMRDKGYFDHNSPTYGSPFDMMKQFGITYRAAGENIAKGYKTPAAVMDGWMNSPGHRANILNSNFTEIGVGYVTDGNGTGYWVQMFIRP